MSPPFWVWFGLNCIFTLWNTSEADFKRKRLKNDFQGRPADPQHVKNVLPHTSQILRHQLLTTPLLLDWSMMRNIHSLQIFTAWSYKCSEHSPIDRLFQCCLKKRQKIRDLTFWTALVWGKINEIHESLTGLWFIFTGITYVDFVQFWW